MLNPELRKNIWIDFTLHRSILLLVVISLLVYLVYLNSSKASELAFNISCFFIFLWGPKSASETVIEEVNNNTWDFQRQSAISPWSMGWGKLIGSTLYSWYGAFFALFLYAVLSPESLTSIFEQILILIMGGIFTQSLALLLSLQLLPQIRREKNNRTIKYFISAALIGIIFSEICYEAIVKNLSLTVHWHGLLFAIKPFAYVSLILFMGWTLLGLERSFSKELQYQHIPWVWGIFNLFCMIYFSGFADLNTNALSNLNLQNMQDIHAVEHQLQKAPYYIAFIIAQLLTYFALLSDELTTVRYKKLLMRFKEKNYQECCQLFPWWTISYLLTLISGVIAIQHARELNQLLEHFSLATLIFTNILFIGRDIFLIHYFSFGKEPRKAASSAILYLFLLYLLVPLVLKALHFNQFLPIFVPSWGQNTPLALIAILLQISFLATLCWKRWQKNMVL